MRVALVCTGLGNVNRGYEASVRELYQALAGKLDVVLFQGGPEGPGITCSTTLPRDSWVYRLPLLNRIREYSRYAIENYTFAISFLVRIFLQPVDVIFCPDHVLALLLHRLAPVLRHHPRVIFSNGAPFENSFCRRFRFVHQKSYKHYMEFSKTQAASDTLVYLVPNGFRGERLARPSNFDTKTTRGFFRLPTDKFIVLCLSAIEHTHKRVDWVIDEFANLDQEKYFLVLAGQETSESNTLRVRAERRLTAYSVMTIPYQDVPKLIWCSSAMVLGSLSEGFPRVVAEAMGSRCHIIVHPHQNTRWILADNQRCLTDMTVAGALCSSIERAREESKEIADSIERNYARFTDEFDWSKVAADYERMFQSVFHAPRI